jgi:hypothetical protein
MQYYTFTRTYMVPAQNKYVARVIFSRALENGEEDRYYVSTTIEAPQKPKRVRTTHASKLVSLLSWFMAEAYNQIAGYPKYHRQR